MNQPCKSNKKCFETENDALAFEKSNREKYNLATQHAYKCDECPAFHLSALPPGTEGMGRINYSNFGRVVGTRGTKRQDISKEQEAEIVKMRTDGIPVRIISEKTGINMGRLGTFMRENDLVSTRGPRTVSAVGSRRPTSIDSIAERKEQLRRQLEALDQQEQDFIRFNMLHVTQEGAVTVIKKGQETLHLFEADVNALMEQLIEKVA